MTVKLHLTIQRWRVSTHFRVFRGNGLANFEFEFRLGFPRHSPKTVAAHDAVWNTVELDCGPKVSDG